MGYINKIQIDNDSIHLIEPTLFAITEGTASAYIAEISNFELISGVNIYLQVHNNNKQNATLNINNLGEKDIFYKNKKIVADQLKKDYLYSLVYDGVKWQLVGDTSGIWEGNAETSTKWAAAQTVYVALDVASKTTSIQGGGSAVALGIDGILGPAHGGTGKTSLKDAGNAIINALDTGSSVLTGEDYMITQYVGGGTTTETYYRRKAKYIRVGGLTTARKLWGNDFDGTADISGGLTVFGGIGLNHNTIDLKVSNNGVSSNTSRVFAWYDKSSLYYARIYGRTDTDGKTHLFLHAGNYDTAQHFGGIDITSAKDGTITYSISAPANFRSAIGTWTLISDSYNTIMPADGTTNGWYKFGTSNTSYGILPSASGTAGSGHNFIGTSTWYWEYSYIDEMYARNLTLSGANDGIYYTGSKATYQMIRFIDNMSDVYGNGIAIGGGGQTIIGGGESASALAGQTSTNGTKIMWIGNDGDIELFPGQQSGFNDAYKTTINSNGISIGIEGNTTKESNLKVSSGAGSIGLYSSSSTTGNRGLWAYPHGTATSGKNIITLDTDNNINYASGTAGNLYMASGSGIVNSSGTPSFYFLRGNDQTAPNRMGLIFCNYGTTNSITRCDRFYLRHYSYNSSTGAAINNWDQYRLPAATPDLTSNHSYDILTTKDMSFSITGNAATATKANALANLYDSRPTDANIAHVTNGGVTHFKATGSMTSNKPGNGNILHFHWDSPEAWDSQLYVPDNTASMRYRAHTNASTWYDWRTLLDSTNYSSYAVSAITSIDEVVPRFNGTTGQIQGSRMSIDDNGVINFSYNGRYPGNTHLFNASNNHVASYWYDTGHATNVTSGVFRWRQYSPNTTADTTTTGHHETYSLPTVTLGLTADKTYSILTTKDMSFSITGNAATATKLAIAREIYVNLSSTRNTSNKVTFDGSAETTAIHVYGTLPIARGGTGKTTALEAITNLGGPYLKAAGTEITANSNLDSDYKAMGTYYSANSDRTATLAGTVPTSGSSFKMITAIGYGAANLMQFLKSYNNPLMYRSSTDTGATWSKWYEFVLLPSGSDNKTFAAIGGATTPVYVNSSGVITAGTALGGAAYKAADYYSVSTHTHGNITNAGCITTAITVASSDYIIIGDSSNSGKLGKGPVFNTDNTTKWLTQAGTWTTPTAANVGAATSSHTHGNITNGGCITTAITIANGDYLIVGDTSASGKIGKGPAFDASTATKCLTQKGTWATFGTSNLALGTTSTTAMKGDTVVNQVSQGATTTGSWRKIVLSGGDAYTAFDTAVRDTANAVVYVAKAVSVQPSTGSIKATKVYNAVWNDYAECREVETEEPGYCVTESPSGKMIKTYKRLQPGCKITSDTFGTCMGKTDKAKTPIAVAGRVLAYPYRNRSEYSLGTAVCSAPNGTVDIMTREEIMTYPERIIGTVSEIPTYEVWHGGNQDGENDIFVNGRIWIYVR